jgi:hypothetical protein
MALEIDYSDPVVGGQGIEQATADQVTNPALPAGTQTPTIDIQENQNELLTDQPLQDVSATPTAPIATGTTSAVDQTQVDDIANVEASTYDATQSTAQQGTVTEESTVQGQLKNLMQDVEEGTATWANGAIRHANQQMIARGIGASSVAGAAISTAIMEAAVPIAKLDAATFGQMNLENLRNRQSTMLSNTAATNAAKQFDAKNKQEIDQFMASFRDRMVRFNVEQSNEMSRFGADQTNSGNQFYDKMQNETDKFLAQNKMTVAKSNAEWRRTLNLANTAAANASLQQDVQNRFNMSQQAQADLWQRARDAFHWANQSSENEKERASKIAFYALGREDFLDDRGHDEKAALFAGVGRFASDLLLQYASTV